MPWKPTSDLPDDFDFTITNAYFGPAQYEGKGPDAIALQWEGESPDIDLSRPIQFTIGKDWEVIKQGAAVQHPKRSEFSASSNYGLLIKRVVEELGVDMSKRGKDTEAAVWVGLSFHMKREVRKFSGGLAGGSEAQVLLPTAVLGEGNTKGEADEEAELALAELAVSSATEREFKVAALKLTKDNPKLKTRVMDTKTSLWKELGGGE